MNIIQNFYIEKQKIANMTNFASATQQSFRKDKVKRNTYSQNFIKPINAVIPHPQ